MPWVRFDDQYPQHPKIGPLTDRLYRLHNEAIFWSARHTTDGVIRAELLTQVRANAKRTDAAELVRRRLFHGADDPPCPSPQCPPPGPDGWVIHDYWDYQPSRADVAKEQKAKAERQRRWREKKSGRYQSADASRNASRDGLSDASGDALVTPAPPRPAPKEGGSGGSRSGPPAAAADAVAGDGGGPTSNGRPSAQNSTDADWPTDDPAVIAAEVEATAAAKRDAAEQLASTARRGAAAVRAALAHQEGPR